MNVTIPLVAPVRFSGGGLSLQTTISRLGPEGLFVRSLVSPKEGSRMELSLSLPGAALPLRMTGIVGPRPADVGRNAGFWVMFEGMSDDTRAFLDAVLRGRGAEGTRMLERPETP